MSLRANWSYPTAIRFGAGRLDELPEAVQAARITRPLLVTDRGLADLPVTRAALDLLDGAGLRPGVFAEARPNPTEVNLEAGVAAFRGGGYDGVVALGGGSALDLGKCIAFMQGQTRPVWEFEDIGERWRRADHTTIAAVVAVPTTAGTGSEVGRAGVITNTADRVKKIIFHPLMLPAVVICDPELTVGLPPALTAGTGMDAFAHCLEAYCAPAYHPMSEGIAVEGLRLVRENLPRAYAAPDDIEARAQMMSAAAMGSVAFQKGLGAIHALSHPIGALHETHHGMTNAVVMPAVLRFNRPAIEDRIARLAAFLGIAGGFDGFLDFVLELRATLGVPEGLAALGVPDDSFGRIAAMAPEDPTAAGNPVPLTPELARQMLQAAR